MLLGKDMQSNWLAKKKKSSCILFLAGWGMDTSPFRSIPAVDHDLLIVYDYRLINPSDIIKQVETYVSLHLVAWSMGVWIAGKFFIPFRDRFTSTTAINGTLNPIDDQFGIPPEPFDEMVRSFSPQVLEKFYRDMFDQPDNAERFLNTRPNRPLESIASELQTFRQNYNELGPGEDIFTSKIVGSRDRIFQARSQLRSWGKKNCTRIKAGHFPFYDWSSWDTIIDGGSQG